jgi:hypothetical protein
MTGKKWIVTCVVLALLTLSAVVTVMAASPAREMRSQDAKAPGASVGTAFTYQGQLKQDGQTVTDTCDMAFRLYDHATAGSQVGSAITTSVSISDGLFTARLDFGGAVFGGDGRWLGIRLQCSDDSAYSDLGRHELTAVPYALHALSVAWSGVIDVPADIADGDDDTTYTAGEGLALNGAEFSAVGSAYDNVIIVAKSGGDYTSVQAAINSISDAAADSAYLVWIAPGVYDETVMMKPYVHLQGAGQEATIITSAVGNSIPQLTQATLVLTRYVSLRDLTISNSGADTYNVALLATDGVTQTLVTNVTARTQGTGVGNHAIRVMGSGTSVTLRDVTAIAHARPQVSGSGYAISTYDGAILIAENVTALSEGDEGNSGFNNQAIATLLGGSFTARGGSNATGVYNDNVGTLKAVGITVLAENGQNLNQGLINHGSAVATLRGGSFIGRGGNDAFGIYNYGDMKAEHITALGENGSNNYGLSDSAAAITSVTQSVLEGATNSVIQSSGVITVSNSRLVGGGVSGSVTCVLVTRGTSVSTDGSTCP